jgi:hypothetical protein
VLSFRIRISVDIPFTLTITVNLHYYVSTACLNVLYSILIMLLDNSDHLYRIEQGCFVLKVIEGV